MLPYCHDHKSLLLTILLPLLSPPQGITIRHVDLFSGDSLRPWFMRINPASTVPVLVIDDKVWDKVPT